MSKFPNVDLIEVRAWGHQVGAVAADDATRAYAFQYSDAWIEDGTDLSPIFCPLPEAGAPPRVYAFPDLSEEGFQKLPGFLADSLPDRFGNSVIRAYMARHGFEGDYISPLTKMAYIGSRAMGALEFQPAHKLPKGADAILDIKQLVEAARTALDASLDGPQDQQSQAMEQLIAVGSSAGGMRAKAVVAWDADTQTLRSGQLNAPDGFSHWLLKFDGMGKEGAPLGGTSHYGRIEYAYHLMASAAGIEMMPCRLLEENGRAHFMTQRFDRAGNQRIHAVTLGGLMHMDYNARDANDYAQLFQAVSRLGLGQEAIDESFRRMVFNVMARNHDDHVKNFGFLMHKSGQWALAPAYDLCHAYDPSNEWVNRHLMLVNGKGDGPGDPITLADLQAVAGSVNVSRPQAIIQDVMDAIDSWPEFAGNAGLDSRNADKIAKDFRRFRSSRKARPQQVDTEYPR